MTDPRLYVLEYREQLYYVEALDMAHAIERWLESMPATTGDPERCLLLSEEKVIR